MKFLGKQSQRLNLNRLQSQLDDNTGKWGGKINRTHLLWREHCWISMNHTFCLNVVKETTGPVLFKAWRLETMLGVS